MLASMALRPAHHKQIARHLLSCWGDRTRVLEMHAKGTAVLQPIAVAKDVPARGAVAYSTIGLSDHCGFELATVGAARNKSFIKAVFDVASLIVDGYRKATPGTMFENVIGRYYSRAEAAHFLIAKAPLPRLELPTVKTERGVVRWLYLWPLVSDETLALDEEGYRKLETKLVEARRVDFLDLDRAPIPGVRERDPWASAPPRVLVHTLDGWRFSKRLGALLAKLGLDRAGMKLVQYAHREDAPADALEHLPERNPRKHLEPLLYGAAKLIGKLAATAIGAGFEKTDEGLVWVEPAYGCHWSETQKNVERAFRFAGFTVVEPKSIKGTPNLDALEGLLSPDDAVLARSLRALMDGWPNPDTSTADLAELLLAHAHAGGSARQVRTRMQERFSRLDVNPQHLRRYFEGVVGPAHDVAEALFKRSSSAPPKPKRAAGTSKRSTKRKARRRARKRN